MKHASHLTRFTKLLSLMLVLSMVLCLVPFSASAAAATPKLSRKSVTLTVGKSVKCSVKGSHIVSVRYTSLNKKIAAVSRKGKTAAIKGKKQGSCKVKAVIRYKKTAKSKKISRKTLYIKVKVRKAKAAQQEDPEEDETESDSSTLSDAFVSQTADFSVSLLKQASGKKLASGKNVLLSAESVLNAMLMTASGAGGTTLTQLTDTLCGSESLNDYLQEFSVYNNRLQSSEKVTFHSANSIWLKDDEKQFTVNEDFLNSNNALLNAEIYRDAFDQETVNKINSWVNKHTNGMIPKIVNEIDEDNIMYLINALAFEGQWEQPYDEKKTEKGSTFTNAQGKTESADMLCSTGYTYLSDDKAKGFMRNYEGGRYAFVAIRPNDGITAEEYLEDMTGESFLSFCQSTQNAKVITKLPKFSYDDSYDLADALKAMGVTDAFDEIKADFSGIGSSPQGENIYLSEVIHKTHIELDENGTKAAAATAVIARLTSSGPDRQEPIVIALDKPFIYAIVDTQTSLPVFMGVVNTLK